MRAGGQVRLHADDGLNVVGLGLAPEVEGAEEEAVVAGGHGTHAQLLGVVEEVAQARGTVQHGVLGVHVQVRKVFGCHGYLLKVWGGVPTDPFDGRRGRCGPGVSRAVPG